MAPLLALPYLSLFAILTTTTTTILIMLKNSVVVLSPPTPDYQIRRMSLHSLSPFPAVLCEVTVPSTNMFTLEIWESVGRMYLRRSVDENVDVDDDDYDYDYDYDDDRTPRTPEYTHIADWVPFISSSSAETKSPSAVIRSSGDPITVTGLVNFSFSFESILAPSLPLPLVILSTALHSFGVVDFLSIGISHIRHPILRSKFTLSTTCENKVNLFHLPYPQILDRCVRRETGRHRFDN